MTGRVTLVSFQEGSDLLKELASVEVNAKMVERAAEQLGGGDRRARAALY